MIDHITSPPFHAVTIPQALLWDEQVSAAAVRVYGLLAARFEDLYFVDDPTHPGHDAFHELVAAGWVTIDELHPPDGDPETVISLHAAPPTPAASSDDPEFVDLYEMRRVAA